MAYPAPPALDPSKVSIRVGDQVLTPQSPVNVAVEGLVDGIPTPSVFPQPDAFNTPPDVQQPVASQFYNWAQVSPANKDAYTALIQGQFGSNVLWEKAALCPARLDNGSHDPTCKLCIYGVYFFDPIKCSMLVQSASLQQQFYLQGQFRSGTSMITSLAENAIAYGDRVTVLKNNVRDQELRQRTTGSLIDKVKSPITSVILLLTKTKRYRVDSDFVVTADGFIEWTKAKKNRPEDGEYYSLVYTHRPDYLVKDSPHNHRERIVKQGTTQEQTLLLPVQALASLNYFPRDEGKDATEVSYPSPFSP